MVKFITVLFLTMLTTFSFSQAKLDNDKKTLELVCDKIMNLFKDSKFSDGIDTLKSHSNIDPSGFDNLLTTIKQQMNGAIPRFGKLIGQEFIKEKQIKNFLSRRLYVLKFENYFVEAYFNLYNNGSGWTITYFGLTQDTEDLF